MSTPLKVRVTKVMLDKERNLIYDLNAFEELEELYGSLDGAFIAFGSGTHKIRNLKRFLFAGLVHEDEALTVKSVGKLIGYSNVEEITDRVMAAVTVAMAEDDGTAPPSGE